jgi:hypothetical protein
LLLGVAFAAVPAAGAMAKSDHDGMPSRWEKRNHLSVRVNDAAKDPDKDGLSNFGEYRSHTDPRRRDSDRDRRADGREDFDRDKLRNAQEIKTGNDPGDADSDDDGIKDGRENAGQITAVTGGVVRIVLAAGGSLTARVGPQLACAAASATPWSEPAPVLADSDEGGDIPETGEDDDIDDIPDEDAPAQAAALNEDAGPADDGVLEPPDPACTTTLKPKAIVHEAVVVRTGEGVFLTEIELLEEHG